MQYRNIIIFSNESTLSDKSFFMIKSYPTEVEDWLVLIYEESLHPFFLILSCRLPSIYNLPHVDLEAKFRFKQKGAV